MDEQKINDILAVLSEQRNAALNEVAMLKAEIAKLNRESEAAKKPAEDSDATVSDECRYGSHQDIPR